MRSDSRPGALVCFFLQGYGVMRFLAEFFRQPDPQIGLFWDLLSMGQNLSLALILSGFLIRAFLPPGSSKAP